MRSFSDISWRGRVNARCGNAEKNYGMSSEFKPTFRGPYALPAHHFTFDLLLLHPIKNPFASYALKLNQESERASRVLLHVVNSQIIPRH